VNKLFLALALVLVSIVDALAQAPFFQDKTIRIIAGYGAGSVDDAWTRMVARYLGKYIPGNPNVIVQNMPGAGAMIAANHVYKVAKPDGLTMGGLRAGLYFDQLVGKKEVQFDWPKFTWLGTPTQIEQLIYMRANTPYKSMHDVRKATVPAQVRRQRHGFHWLLLRQPSRGNTGHKVQHTYRLQRRPGGRSSGRTRRDPLPGHFHRNHVRTRAVDQLVQKWFCPRSDSNRKKARSAAT
jgi:hypothetical protein